MPSPANDFGMGANLSRAPSTRPDFRSVAEETVKSAVALNQQLVQLRDRLTLVLGPGLSRDEAPPPGPPVMCVAHGAFSEVQGALRGSHQVVQELVERLWL